jgi:hypothetical protein
MVVAASDCFVGVVVGDVSDVVDADDVGGVGVLAVETDETV